MVSAIIVAAGRGTRMGPNVDKLFLEIAGRPVVAHTWSRFDRFHGVDDLVIVVRDGMQDAFRQIAEDQSFSKPYSLVVGGKERQDSVWNGLCQLSPSCGIVLIQDGARPCTAEAVISGTIEAARRSGAAVAAHGVTDTVKESRDGRFIERTLDRSRLWTVQTPQAFQTEIIRRALTTVRERGVVVTDDTAACELIGQPVELVVSHLPNPKVTRSEDLPYIESLLGR
jgi:2-C-methyl-D-erythritol 4-phosphate cytidylyltransferase